MENTQNETQNTQPCVNYTSETPAEFVRTAMQRAREKRAAIAIGKALRSLGRKYAKNAPTFKERTSKRDRPTLTNAIVAKLKPPRIGGYGHHWDGEIERFGIRISAATGAKDWIVDYTVNGKRYRKVLGTFPAMRDRDARDMALKVRAAARDGKHVDELAPRDRGAGGLGDVTSMQYLCDEWLDRAKRKKRSWEADAATIKNYILPHFGAATPVASVKYIHAEKLHRQITDDGSPVRANRVLSLCAAMFNHAEKLELRRQNDNPCKGVEKNRELPREQTLTRAGIANLLEACDRHSDLRTANAIRWLLFTGCRRGEALAATWDEFTTDETGMITWTKPSAHVKTKRDHKVPLNAAAAELFRSMRAVATTPFLFPTDDGKHHLVDIKKGWRAICRRAGIADTLHLHDLRHTFVTALVTSGVPLMLAGKLAGHTQAATTQRYANVGDMAALLAASDAMTAMLPSPAKMKDETAAA